MTRRISFCSAAAALALLATPVLEAGAQTFYPAFQPPRTVEREFNFGVVSADVGTVLLFQWREGWSPISQLTFEGGVLDPDGDGDVSLVAGATYARQLVRSSEAMPLDFLLTAGANALIGDSFGFEIPVGVSLGHRFPLEQGLALTPYLHPRVSMQYCNECGSGGDSDTDLGVAFDVGLDFEVSPRLSLRGTFMFGSDDNDGIGFGLAWRPGGLRR